MNKSIWKEHATIHKQISEFTHSNKEKPHTPWHQLKKSQRREIIEHRHSCNNYTKIFIGFFIASVAIAGVVSLKKEAKSATADQEKVTSIAKHRFSLDMRVGEKAFKQNMLTNH